MFLFHPYCQRRRSFVEKADALVKTAISACDNGPPVPPQKLEADMAVEIQVRQAACACALSIVSWLSLLVGLLVK